MIFQGDVRLFTAVSLGLDDIRKNPWLIQDVLGDFLSNPYLAARYASQIPDCLKWLEENRINVYLAERDDKMDFPCITISLGECNELPELKTMADISTETIDLQPNKINRPMPYVIKPLAGSYNGTTGIFTFSTSANLTVVAPKMVLVDPITSTGYTILGVDANGISIGPGLTLSAAAYGVIPQFQYYQAKVGHTFFAESYVIGCHAQDQQSNLWLHSIVMYSLLRYRQALLEANGFTQTIIRNSPLFPNGDFSDAAQAIWTRNITISGQTEGSWIMAPHRFVETVNFKDPASAEGYFGGIKIASNLDSTDDPTQVNWQTVADYPDFMAGEGNE